MYMKGSKQLNRVHQLSGHMHQEITVLFSKVLISCESHMYPV